MWYLIINNPFCDLITRIGKNGFTQDIQSGFFVRLLLVFYWSARCNPQWYVFINSGKRQLNTEGEGVALFPLSLQAFM